MDLGTYYLRAYSMAVGWFDIVYGHAMVLVYLVSIYSQYLEEDNGVYIFVLWLNFVFSIVQVMEGALLVYGVRSKSELLLLVSSVVGILLLVADAVGDFLLSFSLPEVSFGMYILGGLLLITLIAIRSFATCAVYLYYKQLKEELYLREKLISSASDVVQIVISQS